MAEIKGEYVMMMDSLVSPAMQSLCREKSGIDFSNLEGQWIPAENFNKYIEALRGRTGDQGPYIVGTRIAETINKIFGVWDQIPTLEEASKAIPQMYLESNRGPDIGTYEITEIGEGHATVVTSGQLDEGFHIGVYAGLVRVYARRMARSETVERMATHGRSVFKYTW